MLAFAEVERMCKRLNLNLSTEELLQLFKQTDARQRGFLDFEDFRRFVKLLKGCPEIDRLFRKARGRGAGKVFDFLVFEKFMREKQRLGLTTQELQAVFEWYSVPLEATSPVSPPPSPPARHMTPETFTSFLLSPNNSALTDTHAKITHAMTHPLSDYYISSASLPLPLPLPLTNPPRPRLRAQR